MIKSQEWKLTFGVWSRTVRLIGDKITIHDTKEDDSHNFTLPWDALINHSNIGSIDVAADILKLASQHAPPSSISKSLLPQWNFWRRFQPKRAPKMEFIVAHPRVRGWTFRAWTTPAGMSHQARDENQKPSSRIESQRWDWVFSHGPTIGNLSLQERTNLQRQLSAALDDADADDTLPPLFPLLDYASLPKTQWEAGDHRNGYKANCEQGWMKWIGWSYPPPEGGVLYEPIEGILTEGFPHLCIAAHESKDAIKNAMIRDKT